MATYKQLSYGSNNDDVKTLQQLLNQKGSYGLQEDGIFGAKTQAAVKDYQKNNSLAVDGIAGEKTWASLTAGANTGSQTNTQSVAPAVQATPEKSYRYDAENDAVYQQALKTLEGVKGDKPVLAGTFDQQVKDLYDQIVNQKDFSYDLNGDALWQQYRDQYTTKGKMAMLDTMGQAATLTGGYGSSYAQGVGQQAYQGYLQQLNDRVPELYQLALDKYNNEQAMLKDKFSAAAQMQADEYGKYQDALSQHNIDLDRAQSAADTAYDRGNSAWLTEEQLRAQDEETQYARQQDNYDKLANLISSTGYTPSQSELEAAGMSAAQATALASYYDQQQRAAKATSGSSGSRSVKAISIPTEIRSQLEKKKTLEEKSAFIDEMERLELINSDTADYMRQVYVTAGTKEKTETGLTAAQLSDLESKLDGWAEKGENYLSTQLSFYVSHYGLDKDYAADLLLYYFPDEEDVNDSSEAVVTKPSSGFFDNPDELKKYLLGSLRI